MVIGILIVCGLLTFESTNKDTNNIRASDHVQTQFLPPRRSPPASALFSSDFEGMEPSGTPLRHHPGLHTLRAKLQGILKSISSFGPTVPRPPIIDSSFDLAGNPVEDSQRQDAVRGLRALKDSVKRDLDVLENVSHSYLDPV